MDPFSAEGQAVGAVLAIKQDLLGTTRLVNGVGIEVGDRVLVLEHSQDLSSRVKVKNLRIGGERRIKWAAVKSKDEL